MPATQRVEINAPNFQRAVFGIRGNANLVIHNFSQKAKQQIKTSQEKGSQSKKGVKKEPKDFLQDYKDACHVSTEGWYGIPAPAFRAGMVSACRLAGFAMTLAKLGIFVVADGFEVETGKPLVKITKGEPKYFESEVRLKPSGVCDLRARPRWDPGWEAMPIIEFDADMFSLKDITNLMMRVGKQVGLCEGRPDSKQSVGQGWGTFDLIGEPVKEKRVKKGDN